MKKIKEIYEPYMLRPMIYMAFTRFVLALFIVLLADFFISQSVGHSVKKNAFFLCAFVFALLAVIAWLRLDGVKLPKLMMMRVNPSKKPSRMYGDMIDYIEERPGIGFDELDDKEKDLCILAADLFCFPAFLLISFIIK
ncbi:MAG: hypothetical protein IJI45_08700 [Anaerolineaceae bacterium]|nr:hypothetical protein [Anaerolineaceae bacterium]